MGERDCGDCGTALIGVGSTVGSARQRPIVFLTCSRCGCAWEQGAGDHLVKRRDRLTPIGPTPGPST
ncbi:MAG: hypothetical protein ACXVJW_04025 [Acidimicrobiia bacterium]